MSSGAGAVARAPTVARASKKIAAARATADEAADAAKAAKKVAARRGKPKPRGRVKGRTTQVAGKVKTRYSGPERAVRRKVRRAGYVRRVANPIAPSVSTSESGRAFGEGTLQAILEEPGKTATTTARAIYGFPAAVVGDAIDLATNRSAFVESQKKYLSSLGGLFTGDPEEVKQTISEEVGLVPHLTAGLGGYAAGRALAGGRTPSIPSAAQAGLNRAVRESVEGKTPAIRQRAKERIDANEWGEPLGQRHTGRKRESERSGVAAEQQAGLGTLENRKGGKRRFGMKAKLDRDWANLDREQLTPNITKADVVPFLVRHRDATPGDVKNIRSKMRESSRAIDPDTKATRAVLDAIEKHPGVLTDPKVQSVVERLVRASEGRSAGRHSIRTGRRQTAPDPRDERARLQPVAWEKGILLPEERRIPGAKSKVRPRKGQDFSKAVRGEAKSLRQRAGRLDAQAAAFSRSRPERAAVLKERAELYRREAEARETVVNRYRRADGLERRAAALEAGAAKNVREGETPRALRAQAVKLRREADVDNARLNESFSSDVGAALAESGRREPGYLPQRDVARVERSPNVNVRHGPKKDKYRSGVLLEEGRIDESARVNLENYHRGRGAIAEVQRQHGFLEEVLLRAPDGERFFTGAEITALRRERKVPAGYDAVPLQNFAAAIQKVDGLRAEVRQKRLATQATQKETQLYGLAPRSNINEFHAQAKRLGDVARTIRATTRAQSIWMLGLSTAWATMQLVATPLVMALRNPNPARWGRAIREGIDIVRNATPEERAAFWAHFGGNPSDFVAIGENVRGLNANAKSAKAAADLAFRNPAGQVVQAVGRHLKEGGPLIKFNRRMEAGLRKFEVLMEMDRLSGVQPSGRPRAFAAAASRLSDTVYTHLKLLEGKKGADKMRAYLDDSKRMRELETATNDAIGQWSALTHAEKNLASVVVFYPFVRFSLSWMAKFPRDNPLKSAVYINLGQQNAQELAGMLEGDPSFWTGWATAVHHAGGEPDMIDLSRAVPGGNVLMEALGSGTNPIQAGLRVTQPGIGGTIAAGYGKDPFGNESKGTFLEQVAKNLTSLNPATRAATRDKIGPEPSVYSELFRRIQDTENPWAAAFIPDVFPSAKAEAEVSNAARLLESAFGGSGEEASRARVELEQLLNKYGLEAAENLSTLGSSSSSSSTSGSTDDGPTPWRGSSPTSSSASSAGTLTPWR